MLLIPCPFCGLRNEEEFTSGSEADRHRPADPIALDDQAWVAHLFERANPKGAVREWWWHGRGCRLWFVLERDTVTNAIKVVP
ncbi:MAG: sarcosine oxidase subunit delta [Alphaproteobacteria bacterium]|nr:sarcosine oxidase subunit delta [Alphaproteobacteria bacterium]